MRKLCLLLLVCSSFLGAHFGPMIPDPPKYEVTICALFRNEERFLREWIEYHLLIGVDHFYLFDNLSDDHSRDVLKPYIEQGVVELFDWPYEQNNAANYVTYVQCTSYNKILKERAFEAAWMAFIDTDEFIVMTEETNLKNFLKKYDRYPGLCINWQLFGTSNVQRIPDNATLIETLIQKAPEQFSHNLHVKCIVKPFYVMGYVDHSHQCNFKPYFHPVDEAKKRVKGAQHPITVNKIRLNHYTLRDLDFYYGEKAERMRRWHDNEIPPPPDYNQETDTTILRFLPALKERLGMK